MKFEHTEIWGFAHALRGMRNPLESWAKSDSICFDGGDAFIGEKDTELMQKLIAAGSEHRKFMRQIFVSVDITAPLYWWKEFNTYRVGVTENSTSTMHKLADTPISLRCFEIDDYHENMELSCAWYSIITELERLRQEYNRTKDKTVWKELVRLLPESWLQTRTVTMNYENILMMYRQRKNHKLNEWSGIDDDSLPNFIAWVKTLPYAQELIINGGD